MKSNSARQQPSLGPGNPIRALLSIAVVIGFCLQPLQPAFATKVKDGERTQLPDLATLSTPLQICDSTLSPQTITERDLVELENAFSRLLAIRESIPANPLFDSLNPLLSGKKEVVKYNGIAYLADIPEDRLFADPNLIGQLDAEQFATYVDRLRMSMDHALRRGGHFPSAQVNYLSHLWRNGGKLSDPEAQKNWIAFYLMQSMRVGSYNFIETLKTKYADLALREKFYAPERAKAPALALDALSFVLATPPIYFALQFFFDLSINAGLEKLVIAFFGSMASFAVFESAQALKRWLLPNRYIKNHRTLTEQGGEAERNVMALLSNQGMRFLIEDLNSPGSRPSKDLSDIFSQLQSELTAAPKSDDELRLSRLSLELATTLHHLTVGFDKRMAEIRLMARNIFQASATETATALSTIFTEVSKFRLSVELQILQLEKLKAAAEQQLSESITSGALLNKQDQLLEKTVQLIERATVDLQLQKLKDLESQIEYLRMQSGSGLQHSLSRVLSEIEGHSQSPSEVRPVLIPLTMPIIR